MLKKWRLWFEWKSLKSLNGEWKQIVCGCWWKAFNLLDWYKRQKQTWEDSWALSEFDFTFTLFRFPVDSETEHFHNLWQWFRIVNEVINCWLQWERTQVSSFGGEQDSNIVGDKQFKSFVWPW